MKLCQWNVNVQSGNPSKAGSCHGFVFLVLLDEQFVRFAGERDSRVLKK